MMSVFINHCWCSDSNWGGHYNCRVIVTIHRIPEGKTYYDPPTEDWTKLVTKHPFNRVNMEDGLSTFRLIPEAVEWLKANVMNKRAYKGELQQGWAIGTDKYNSNSALDLNVFFRSTRDARAFIKRWSSIKKPSSYFNYFTEVRAKYNPATKTLQRVKEIS